MDPVRLTRELIDIESITGNEGEVGNYLHGFLSKLGYSTQKMPVEDVRHNVYATLGERPDLIFSTHMDTVPPFIPSSEDAENIYGRGSCDAKGIIAAQIAAAERLKQEGIYVDLLFLVGEERDSAGAKVANQQKNSCKYLINGEPGPAVGPTDPGIAPPAETRCRQARRPSPGTGEATGHPIDLTSCLYCFMGGGMDWGSHCRDSR